VDIQDNTETQITEVEAAVLAAGLLRPGGVVVSIMVSPVTIPDTTNPLTIHTLQRDKLPG